MWKALDRFFAAVDKIFVALSFVTLAGMTILIALQVFFRYVIHAPLAWTEELARFGFIWMTFFAGYLGARRGQHIGVELIQNLFPAGVKTGMKFVSTLAASVFFFMISYYLITLWGKLAMQTSPALNIPMNYIYLGMLVGALFMGLAYLYETIRIFAPKDVQTEEMEDYSE